MLLLGQCYYEIEKFDEAIEHLDQAREHTNDGEMVLLILMLRVLATRAKVAKFEEQIKIFLDRKQYKQALKLVNEHLAKQPNDLTLLYVKSGVLLKMENLPEARRTALDGLERASGSNKRMFESILNQIEAIEFGKNYDAMQSPLRKRNYDEVKRLLQKNKSKLAGQEHYEAIEGYLLENSKKGFVGRLFGGNQQKKLDYQSRQRLLIWLFSDEIATGMADMSNERWGNAQAKFKKIIDYDTECGLANYFYAISSLRLFEQQAQNGRLDIENTYSNFERASGLLGSVTRDKLVGQQCKSIKGIIDKYMVEMKDALEQSRAMKPLNDLMAEYQKLMGSLNKGISSPSQLKSAITKLSDLRSRAVTLKKTFRKGEANSALTQLIEAIDSNQSQLKELEKDANASQKTQQIIELFNNFMKHLEANPISTREELDGAKKMVDFLLEQVSDARRDTPRGSDGSNALDQLENALRSVKSQLNG